MTLLKIVFGFTTLCGALQAFGAWSSSGGGLSRYTNNPWFVNKNTREVVYCVQVNHEHFPFNEQEVDILIQKSFSFWKTQARRAYFEELPDSLPLIAGQLFVRANSCVDAPIVFQFGFLTSEQKANIPDYKSFLSLAVQTEYDLKTLKGRGFLYFAPETGPDRPTVNYIRPNFWSFAKGLVLRDAIYHEVGHVFGVTHRDAVHNLMNEFHLEWRSIPGNLPEDPVPHEPYSLSINSEAFHTNCVPFGHEFFSAPEDGCLFFRKVKENPFIQVEWAKDSVTNRLILGKISMRVSLHGISSQTAAFVRLPEQQDVYEQNNLGPRAALVIHDTMHGFGDFSVPGALEGRPVIWSLEARRGAINIEGVSDVSGRLSTLVDWDVIWD